MESGDIKFQTMLDDIDRLKAEKRRLEETLEVVRLECMRKQETSARLSRKRAEIANTLKTKHDLLGVIKHRVEQQQAEVSNLQGNVAMKAEGVNHAEIARLKKKQADDADKFDEALESTCAVTKKMYAFYQPSNLDAEINTIVQTQMSVKEEIQTVQLETEKLLAKLQVEDDEGAQDLLVDADTQQLIESLLSERDKATATTLDTVNEQCDQLHMQIDELN